MGTLVRNPRDRSLPGSASSVADNLDHAFGHFQLLPGGDAIKQTAAEYPFANQHVASNATIFQPLNVSLMWDTAMKTPDAYARKFAIMTNLQAALYEHNNQGGSYAIVTPSFIYTDMILLNMTDRSRPGPLPQNAWQFDFTKPLIRISDLVAAQSAMMAKLTKGLQTDGSWTGTQAGLNLGVSLTQMMSRNPLAIPSAFGTLNPPGIPG